MEESQISTRQVSLRYGLIAGLAAIAFFVLMDLLGQSGNQPLQYVQYLILAIIIFFAHKYFKDEGDGYLKFGQGLGIGVLISLISSVVSSIFFYIYVTFINTDYLSYMRDLQIEEMEKQGMSDAQIDQALGFMDNIMNPPVLMVISIISTVFFGLIISLIIAAITQKKKPENEVG